MRRTVLLVDDEPYILKSLERLLSEEGYHVLTAASGPEGLALLKSNPIQVVISDQRMPLVKGSEFLRQVKILYPNTIRMILSAYVDFDAIQESINEGAIYKFICKPWNEEILLKYIKEGFDLYFKNQEATPSILKPERDVLTKLYNRFAFYELLMKKLTILEKNQDNLALCYFDVDRFSHINASLGQKNGDLILQWLAKRLKKFVKNEKNLARLGNDEFIIVITDKKDLANLSTYINSLLAVINTPMIINKTEIFLTASIGVSLFPSHGKNIDELMRNSRDALLTSKESGGNQCKIYEHLMNPGVENKLFLETELHRALEKNQFLVHYQPIYSVTTNKIAMLEALIRWENPHQGVLGPSQFLPFCEETNLILPIGEWVLKTVCQQAKKWYDLGLTSLRVAINLSARQINNPGLINLIVSILETTQLPPSFLELEITETIIIHNTKHIVSMLNTLKSLGIHLSLDDFGTGYSSLSYLKQFPFDTLKIDRSFIHDIGSTSNASNLVDAIITMAKNLNLKVIAEGVETEEQAALLCEKKCDYIQGYLYGKPLSTEEVSLLLKS
ncbi:TPA: EAL domain-containing protein [Legionella pneumophila]|nr:EAL domain-containing protein [Legionella pneumophila]HAT8181060.1 EAL domain-containing protein [Legionella pneumophila]